MTTNDMLSLAASIAMDAHCSQRDKAGEPYMFHVMRVALSLDDPTERAVALLHDVVEDTVWTLYDLRDNGVPDEVVGAVAALTRRKGEFPETYADYIQRVARNDLARAVKLADLQDNLRPERIAMLPPDEAASLAKRYHAAVRTLLGA